MKIIILLVAVFKCIIMKKGNIGVTKKLWLICVNVIVMIMRLQLLFKNWQDNFEVFKK